MRERVEAMKAIWTQDEASYHGELRRLRAHLVLAQAGPAAAPAGARRRQRPDACSTASLRFGDAWMPNFARGGVLERIPELRARAEHPGDRRWASPPTRPCSNGCARRACSAPCAGSRRPARSQVEQALERFEAAVAQLNGES